METKFSIDDWVDVHEGTFLSGGRIIDINIENDFSDKPIYFILGYDEHKNFWYREKQLSFAINPNTD